MRTNEKQTPEELEMNRDTLSDLVGALAISVTAVILFSLPSVAPILTVA